MISYVLAKAFSLTLIYFISSSKVMTVASLPSTLVKCLYLFFDLPKLDSEEGIGEEERDKEASEAGNYSSKEKRVLLQKIFLQVLIRLCTYQPAVEELARKDDLTLLFSAITSDCPSHNMMWRKTSADILLTISRHSLSQPVISYLHGKKIVFLFFLQHKYSFLITNCDLCCRQRLYKSVY